MPEDKVRKIELPRLDPKEVGLLVVDMQNGFCHPEGARAKAFGVDAIAMPRARIPSHLDRRGVKLELCWRGTWDSELIDEIKAEIRPEDDIVIKHRASAFYNTPLEAERR